MNKLFKTFSKRGETAGRHFSQHFKELYAVILEVYA